MPARLIGKLILQGYLEAKVSERLRLVDSRLIVGDGLVSELNALRYVLKVQNLGTSEDKIKRDSRRDA